MVKFMKEAMNSEYMGRFKLKGVVDVSFTAAVFFCVFFTRSLTASSPLQGELCKGKFCGEGRCQETQPFPFAECICSPGWSNFQNITSLPCVLPNCTIHSQCGNAALPPSKSSPAPPDRPPFQLLNTSDPCQINFCGADGSCVVTNGSDFKCQCSKGSSNLLNDPKFPCFHKCNLGEDCKGVNLGFNEAPPPFRPPPLANSVSPEDEGILCGLLAAFCMEGTCEDDVFPFVKCHCNDGWTNFNNDPHLPCVLPNCTINFNCGNGSPPPPPAAPPPSGLQLNLTEPCGIPGICGPDGRCESDGSDRKCQCSDDGANLLGDPKFPCFKKCNLGADCNGLNLGFNQPPAPPSNNQPPAPPSNSVSPTNGDLLNGSGKLDMLVSMMVIAALLPRI